MVQKTDVFFQAVQDDLLALVGESQLTGAFARAIHLALQYDGKVLSSNPRSRWPLMVLLPCWGVGGDWRRAVPWATAAELVGIATDVFDEIEDSDRCPLAMELGVSRAINAASALLTLALNSLGRLPGGASAPLWRALLTAADGQHQELGRLAPATAEEYLSLVDRKSAGLTSALCAMGALAAGSEPPAVDGFAGFGRHLGRWAQLLNDLHDLWPGSDGKSDLQRRLVTLPVLFVMQGPHNAIRDLLRRHLASDGPLLPSEEQELRQALWASGALHYTWLMAETNRGHAEARLREVCPSAAADTILDILLPPVPSVEQLITSL